MPNIRHTLAEWNKLLEYVEPGETLERKIKQAVKNGYGDGATIMLNKAESLELEEAEAEMEKQEGTG